MSNIYMPWIIFTPAEKPDFSKLTILPFWQRVVGVQNRQRVEKGREDQKKEENKERKRERKEK